LTKQKFSPLSPKNAAEFSTLSPAAKPMAEEEAKWEEE
jgi:hypothetical protein